MILYHGGTDTVNAPEIITTYSGRDFGAGFYTTEIRDQATKWAKRQARYRRSPVAILNTYELHDDAIHKLNVKSFDDYEMEWLDFVVSCRQNAGFTHDFDIVMGKVANDDVGETVQAVVDGLTSKEFALSRLVFMHANNQICLSTEKALKYLTFISAERVD